MFRGRRANTSHWFKVGNGGFSLRNVATMRHIVTTQRDRIERLLDTGHDSGHHIEDVYFDRRADADARAFPTIARRSDFCIDRKPDIALRINGGRAADGVPPFFRPQGSALLAPDHRVLRGGDGRVATPTRGVTQRRLETHDDAEVPALKF